MQGKMVCIEIHLPLIRPLQEIQTAQEGGLSRAAGPQDHHYISLIHLDIHSLEDFILMVFLMYITDLQHIHTCFPRDSRYRPTCCSAK